MTQVAIVQSNYIPWRGYFDLIRQADLFILLDEVQYTKRDWRNRNRIKTPSGPKWLTIPVKVKGKYHQRISEVEVANQDWAQNHWRQLTAAYAKAPCFETVEPMIKGWYEQAQNMTRLSDINRFFLQQICDYLDVNTPIVSSSNFHLHTGKSERLLQLCLDVGSETYISGPAAKNYLDTSKFEKENIAVKWFEYPEYPVYQQLHGCFEPALSIIDTIAHCGSQIFHTDLNN